MVLSNSLLSGEGIIIQRDMEYTHEELEQYRHDPLELIQWMGREGFLSLESAQCGGCGSTMDLHCTPLLNVPVVTAGCSYCRSLSHAASPRSAA